MGNFHQDYDEEVNLTYRWVTSDSWKLPWEVGTKAVNVRASEGTQNTKKKIDNDLQLTLCNYLIWWVRIVSKSQIIITIGSDFWSQFWNPKLKLETL
jgi:hypothetical protein